MSRTFRRLPDQPYLDYLLHFRRPELELRSFASRHRDRHRTYLRSVPHEWVNRFATRPLRRHDRHEIHRCTRLDAWEDHIPGVYRRKNYPYYW